MFTHRLDDHCELRLLQVADAAELFHLCDQNHAFLRRWLTWPDAVQQVADTRAFIENALRIFADGRGMVAGVCVDGCLAGTIRYTCSDLPPKSATIGYWLAESHEGRGIMTRACRAVLKHGFGTLGLNRMEITCAVENRRSRAIPERLGFTQEGVMREADWLHDRYVDHALYSLLRREWEQAAG